jgi:hypothetical protein
MMESYFFIPQFFLASFDLPPNSHGTPADHLHQCAAAHRLKIAGLKYYLAH